MKNIIVSVILPTYNGNTKWLSESIDSVLNQTYTNFELIIINDASTNDIEKDILEYLKKDNRIIYIKNKTNKERSFSKNKGIKLSKGKYIAFIDDDDIWYDKDKLKKQIDFMEQNSDYGLCGTGIILINEEGKELNRILNKGYDQDIRNNISGFNQFAQSSIIIRKTILKKSGLFNIKYSLAEDYDLWFRIGIYSKFYNIQKHCIKYRDRIGNSSNKNKIKQKYITYLLYFTYFKYYPNKISGFIIQFLIFFFPKYIISYMVKLNQIINNLNR